MIKRFTAVCLSVLLLLSLCGGAAVSARAETVTFSLSVTEGQKGDTVTVSIDLSEQSYFTNATFYLHYDPAVVAYVWESEATGDASPRMNTMFAAVDHTDKSYVKGVYVTVNGIDEGGTLLTIDFDVLSDKPAVFSLTFDECCGADESNIEFDVNYKTVGCVLNNNTDPDTSVVAPTVVATTTASKTDSGNAATTAPADPPVTTTPYGSDGPSGGDDGPAADATTVPQGESGDSADATTMPVQGGVDTTTTTLLGSLIDIEKQEPVPSNIGTIIVIAVACLVLAGGVTALAIIAAKKAKKDE